MTRISITPNYIEIMLRDDKEENSVPLSFLIAPGAAMRRVGLKAHHSCAVGRTASDRRILRSYLCPILPKMQQMPTSLWGGLGIRSIEERTRNREYFNSVGYFALRLP